LIVLINNYINSERSGLDADYLPLTYPEGERYPETRGRHFKGRNRRDTGQEEGGTHAFYSDFSGHGTETSN